MNNNNTPQVVARLTVIRKLGVRTIIEVSSDATFQAFYRYFSQDGRRSSTKKLVRTASRNEGLPYVNAHLARPGIELLACRWATMQHVESVQVRILRKREYARLIGANPSELGQAIVRPVFAVPHLLTKEIAA